MSISLDTDVPRWQLTYMGMVGYESVERVGCVLCEWRRPPWTVKPEGRDSLSHSRTMCRFTEQAGGPMAAREQVEPGVGLGRFDVILNIQNPRMGLTKVQWFELDGCKVSVGPTGLMHGSRVIIRGEEDASPCFFNSSSSSSFSPRDSMRGSWGRQAKR